MADPTPAPNRLHRPAPLAPLGRRRVLGALGLSAAAASAAVLRPGGALAACLRTPRQSAGPFYPPRFGAPDNDLLAPGAEGQGPAGEPIAIVGTVTDARCRPLPGAVLEIWQADAHGRYAHPRDTEPAARDPHFRYWGRAVADARGRYRFRTIRPAPYRMWLSWRTPHVHFKVRRGDAPAGLTTQMYFAGHELNARDGLLNDLPEHEQAVVIARPEPEPDAATGLAAWRFDIALA